MCAQFMCVDIDGAAVQAQSAALHMFMQAAEEEEQAERASEQHLHHFCCLVGELAETFCLLKSLQRNY